MKPILLISGCLLSLLLLGKGAAGQAASGPQAAPRTITLKECLKLSVANSPRIKISGLEQIRLEYSRKATRGIGLPQVSLSGSYDDYLNLPTQMIPNIFSTPPNPSEMIPVQFGTAYNLSGALDVTQVVYNQAWLISLKLARQMEEQNLLMTEKSTIEVVDQVAQSYYLIQITRQQIRNMKSNLDKIEKAEKIASSQYENGLIKKVDLDRITVQKLNLITEVERVEVAYSQMLAMQKYFMGLNQSEEFVPEESIGGQAMTPGTEGDLNKHIDIRLLGAQENLANTNIKMNQAGYLPSLNIFASTSYMNQSNDFYLFGKPSVWFNTSVVGLRLSIPVFSGLQRHYQVSQSRVELEKLKITEDDTKKLIRINSEDAARKLLNSAEAEKRQSENVVLAEKVYGISQEQYQQGLIPLTDLLNAETALSDAQSNHIYALIQMKQAELNYLKANGKLMEVMQ